MGACHWVGVIELDMGIHDLPLPISLWKYWGSVQLLFFFPSRGAVISRLFPPQGSEEGRREGSKALTDQSWPK